MHYYILIFGHTHAQHMYPGQVRDSDTMVIDSMRAIRRRVSTTVGIHTVLAESLITHQIGAADNFTNRLIITLIANGWIKLSVG